MPRALLGIVAVGALARFATLDLQSFWYDEAVTVGLVGDGFGDMLGRIPESESTPPLYYVLAWLWTRLFGEGEVGIRSLSALVGTALIPVCFLAVRELVGSSRAGLIAAALAAVNPILVWYSQEARAYSLLLLLTTVALLYFARLAPWRDGSYERRALVGWAVASALALTAHYFAVFTVLPQAIWLLVRLRPRAPVSAAVGGVALTGAALLPLLIHQRDLDLASFIREAPVLTRLWRLPKHLLTGFDAPIEAVLSVVAVAIAGAAGIWALRRRDEPGVRAAALLALVAVGLPLLLALAGSDYFDTRNVLSAWPLVGAVVAAGLAGSRALGIAGAAVLCAVGAAAVIGTALEPLWQRDDWRGAAQAIGPAEVPRAIVANPPQAARAPLLHYLPRTRTMPARGARAQEIVFVTDRGRPDQNLHPSPPPRLDAPVINQLPPVRKIYGETFTALVLRADRPVPLTPAFLRNYALIGGEKPAVLIERPGA